MISVQLLPGPQALARIGIEQYQTGIRGGVGQALGREAFEWEVDEKERPVAVSCPGGLRTEVDQGRKSHTFLARFDDETCRRCPNRDNCPTRSRKGRRERVLRVTFRQVQAARRIRRSQELHRQGINPRAAVEATVWSLKAPFRRGRVPYRGLARVTMFTVASAAMVNVRRLSALVDHSAGNALGDSLSRLCCSSKTLSDPLRRFLKAIRRLIRPRTGATQRSVPMYNRA